MVLRDGTIIFFCFSGFLRAYSSLLVRDLLSYGDSVLRSGVTFIYWGKSLYVCTIFPLCPTLGCTQYYTLGIYQVGSHELPVMEVSVYA